MEIMFVLIGISLVFAIGFLAAFIYSVKSGQFDDDYTPSVRILFDNKVNPSSHKKQNTCK
ncbi:MAG: cbb3-type cytochrome oxidase assembly protein CcoS [Chitinophagales bacterium]